MFLDDKDLIELTGWHHRSKQVAQLRKMGIPFWLNACGRPIVAKSIFEGGKAKPQPKTWEPTWGVNQA